MYQNFYGLSELPFELTPNPKFLFLPPRHREALSALEYGLSSAKAITLSTATCSSAAGAVPNNVYGYGRLDLGCAVPAKVSGTASVCSGSPATLTVNFAGTGPWTLTWSDGVVQSGVSANPTTRTVSPTSTTTYSLTSVSSTGCNQPGAGSATISMAAAQTKGIVSPVAGQADILVVPDLEAGNMLAKQLMYFAGADAAGIVLGARLPIILTSRADSVRVRLASAALAKLAAERVHVAPISS